jgi:predicted deacylase
LLFDTPPSLTCGTLICAPVVNVFGLEDHSRYLPDRRDLNRSFPGMAKGSLTSRLAYIVFQELVKKADYCIDFHSAATGRTNYPNVRADLRNPETRMLARAFGCELIVHGRGPEGSFRRTATDSGVPAVILEAGEIWKIEPSVVDVGIRGIMNVLRTLGMTSGQPVAARYQTKVRKTTWVRAERGGTLSFGAAAGALVAKDEVLATNYNIFGDERRQMLSPTYGVVLGMSTMPVVKPGDPIYHLAILSRRSYLRIQSQLEQASPNHLFSRVQRHLATSVHTVE